MMKICLLLFVFISLFSFSKSNGDMDKDKNGVVNFLNKSHKEITKKTLDFWVKEIRSRNKTQHLQILEFKNKTIDIQLIVLKNKKSETITFEETKLIVALKSTLDCAAFTPETCQNFSCDDSFNLHFIPKN